MSDWFGRVRRKLNGDAERTSSVRRRFVEAYRSRAKLELREVGGPEPDRVLAASIEQVGQEHVLINQPSVGARTIPIPRGTQLSISFHLDKDRWTCRTHCLGRAKVPSGGSRMIYGYKIAIPDELHHSIKQREHFRIRVGIELAPPAAVTVSTPEDVIRIEGVVEDISEGGMLITTTDGSPPKCRVTQTGKAVFELPEPVGRTEIGVTVRHTGRRNEQAAIGLQFDHEVPDLARMIRELEITRNRRAGAA